MADFGEYAADNLPDLSNMPPCPVCRKSQPFWDAHGTLTCNNGSDRCRFSIEGCATAEQAMDFWRSLAVMEGE